MKVLYIHTCDGWLCTASRVEDDGHYHIAGVVYALANANVQSRDDHCDGLITDPLLLFLPCSIPGLRRSSPTGFRRRSPGYRPPAGQARGGREPSGLCGKDKKKNVPISQFLIAPSISLVEIVIPLSLPNFRFHERVKLPRQYQRWW